MGGRDYDRDVYSESSSSSWGRSSSSFGVSEESREKMGSNKRMDASLNPRDKIIRSHSKHPIIVVLDVTGSNIDFARVVYDKMPMFYGQIEQKGYLRDFDISFCAVGDIFSDKYPIQVGDFAKGLEIDKWLEKVVLEGNGGPFGEESYETMALYLNRNFKCEVYAEPIIFFIGDEIPYASIKDKNFTALGLEKTEDTNSQKEFQNLRDKYDDHVFMLLNKACGRSWYNSIIEKWRTYLNPQHVILIEEEKSIVDLMLGIIAMVFGTRTMESYEADMREREQTEERIRNVKKSLDELSQVVAKATVIGTIPTHKPKEEKDP